MKFVCISASNVKSAKDQSASTRTSELVRELLSQDSSLPVEVSILPLVDYNLKPCNMCGECLTSGVCTYDQAFNVIYSQLIDADGIFVVSPHYAPIPSKLIMILEKLEELCYLAYCAKKPFALRGKFVALIGHGGGSGEEAERYYRQALLQPLSQVFRACGMTVVGSGESEPNGIVFGVTGMKQKEESLLPDMVHDWEDITRRIRPLVQAMLERVAPTT